MPDAVALLKQDHRSVEKLFDRFEKSGDAEIVRRICQELRAHTALEEELAHNGPMRWDQALVVCRQILGSLGEAHALGIIHRDVKPANVYLCAGAPWPARGSAALPRSGRRRATTAGRRATAALMPR